MKTRQRFEVHDVVDGEVQNGYYAEDGWSGFYTHNTKYDPYAHKAELEAKYPFKAFAIIKVTETEEIINA